MVRKILAFVMLSLFFCIGSAKSQEIQQYQYDSIDTNIIVHTDSTFSVSEKQTYKFRGEFHKGWRSISLNKLGSISDVQVVDSETGEIMQYSSQTLDKLSPSSWGKYTYYKSNGNMNVEWYFDVANTTHTWFITYTVHGGVEFGKQFDRLYWNVFTDYDVPVAHSRVTVTLPRVPNADGVGFEAYRANNSQITKTYDRFSGIYTFDGASFDPKEAFTIDASWPKGMVDRGAYWKDLFYQNYGIIISMLLIIITVVTCFVIWLYREGRLKGKGTIIPQYEPPKNITPAMMEIIMKEQVTNRGLSATIIDLAVRGYVTISEDPGLLDKLSKGASESVSKILRIIRWILIVAVTTVFIYFFVILVHDVFNLIFAVIIFLVLTKVAPSPQTKDYRVSKKSEKSYTNDPSLLEYEKEYLNTLFSVGKEFSTRDMRWKSNMVKREFHRRMVKLKEITYKETEEKTNAYVVGPAQEKKKVAIWSTVVFVLIFLTVGMSGSLLMPQYVYLIVVDICMTIILWAYVKFESRLNTDGTQLKEDILGFKMYLHTAERYRLQNLKPEYFEKFLPYAMVFKIEKQWAKAFEKMDLPAPSWYHSYGAVGLATSGHTSTFSPSVFSTSFSSSFRSAFSSSGGSGSAGGGSAGGGGGGGGGGAS